MPKVKVTPELSDALRSLRKQAGISAKALSLSIGKSASYITVLEKNNIKSLDLEDFEEILRGIVGDDEDSLVDAYKSLLAHCKLHYSKNEGTDVLLFNNFDTIRRQIPVPDSLIDWYNETITSCNITREFLIDLINQNLDLTLDELACSSYSNQWELLNGTPGIVIKMDKEYLDCVLDKKIITSNYQFLLAIAYYLFRIQSGSTNRGMDYECKEKAIELLQDNKVYTLEKKLEIENVSNNNINSFLSKDDIHNRKLINEITIALRSISDMDVLRSNERLEKVVTNLHSDLGFYFSFISLDLSKFNNYSIDNKKQFFEALKSFIEEYEPTDKNIELY